MPTPDQETEDDEDDEDDDHDEEEEEEFLRWVRFVRVLRLAISGSFRPMHSTQAKRKMRKGRIQIHGSMLKKCGVYGTWRKRNEKSNMAVTSAAAAVTAPMIVVGDGVWQGHRGTFQNI